MRVMLHFAKYLVGLENAYTSVTEDERNCLKTHANRAQICVEIGVSQGATTRVLRSVMAPDGRIFAVDPFPVGRLGFSAERQIARIEVSRERVGTVQWLRMTSVAAVKWYSTNVRELLDFIFVDGDHSWDGIERDWVGWAPLVKVGVMALHDSRSSEKRIIDDAGSVRYTQAVISKDTRFKRLDEIDSLTVFRRTG